MNEETFGPIIPVMRVGSDEEALKFINDSEFGLTASIWTKDTAKGEELVEQVEAGTVFVNRCDFPSPVSRSGTLRVIGILTAQGSCVDWMEELGQRSHIEQIRFRAICQAEEFPRQAIFKIALWLMKPNGRTAENADEDARGWARANVHLEHSNAKSFLGLCRVAQGNQQFLPLPFQFRELHI